MAYEYMKKMFHIAEHSINATENNTEILSLYIKNGYTYEINM